MSKTPSSTLGIVIRKALLVVLFCAGLGFVLLPIFYAFSLSFRTNAEVLKVPPHLFPPHFSVVGWLNMTDITSVFRYIGNTAIVAATTIAFTVSLAGLAAYTFARLRFRWTNLLMVFLLVSQMFPGAAVIVPLFRTVTKIGLYNSHFGLALVYTGFTIPFCTWMLYGYFKTIPKELEEASSIDGCSRLHALWSIILPLALPGIAATAVFVMLAAWNEYTFASLFIQDNEKWLITPGLTSFIGQYWSAVNSMAAAAISASVPPVVAFILVRRYFISGLVAGAVKG